MLIKETKNMTDSERIAAENSNNQWLQSLSFVAVGTIYPYAGTEAPDTFMICDGSALDVTKYAELFSVIGYTFGGSGDTFNIPDLRGKTLVGLNVADNDFDTIGKTAGEKNHKLTTEELPAHTHDIYKRNWNVVTETSSGLKNDGNVAGNAGSEMTPSGSTGNGKAHNNMPPYTVCNYIIKVMQASTQIAALQPQEFYIDDNGDLIITKMDASTENLGRVVGSDGEITEERLQEYAVPIFENGAPTEVIYAQNTSEAAGVYGGKPITLYVDLAKGNHSVELEPSDNQGCIPMRNEKGNLYTGTPTETMEAANKKYVDDKLGDIEALLGGI